jgi:predicted enzyme related to lactoylglutathione lyase
MPATARIGVFMLDCADAEALAPFWAELLGYEIGSRVTQFIFLRDPERRGLAMGLQQVPEPKERKNRAHVDLIVDDLTSAHDWVIEHGGRKLAQHAIGDFTWYVMADPEGNEFCMHE